MSSIQSEAWTCPNGHFGNVMHGDAEDTWGDTECPVCGAEPGDPINPDAVTGDAPGVDDWIADHRPVSECCEADATFVWPDEREAGLEKIRWQCPHCTAYLTEDGETINVQAYLLKQELAAAKAGKRVAS